MTNEYYDDYERAKNNSCAKPTRKQLVSYYEKKIKKAILKSVLITFSVTFVSGAAILGIPHLVQNDQNIAIQKELNAKMEDFIAFGIDVKGNSENFVTPHRTGYYNEELQQYIHYYDEFDIAKDIAKLCQKSNSPYALDCAINSLDSLIEDHNRDKVISFLSKAFEEDDANYLKIRYCKNIDDYLIRNGFTNAFGNPDIDYFKVVCSERLNHLFLKELSRKMDYDETPENSERNK